ncbi:NAD-dependent epimerase/dehydratase family protein [Mesorhizobium sp. B2-5-9]|uniref:NAD-dependent epimerase/dehydratase family protein n=1 Tax=Mesorhizobium sp. B2-5-9 TaxID=2589921 RepID=UPI001125FEAC|nr:NAD-dependent epimerase/dehydratase family protein [Mesorhizobium sp. B2-5-9]TPK22362.1 NAD-dependent epimerase/dehydratase family protein [Mesorhizobium sp. B2-5-9]
MSHGNPGGKAVILGASGFIGVNLARTIAAKGVEPILFSRSRSPHWPAVSEVILGDLSAPPASLLDAIDGADVFHLASTARPSNSTAGAAGELIDNAAATVRLLEAAKGKACRWIFASSGGTVYGQTEAESIAEDHPNGPISSYGIAKLAIERYLHLYRRLHGTDYVVARISNPYGPFQSASTGQGLVATLLDRVANGERVEVWGDGGNVRDYIYIDDVAEALVRLAEVGAPGETYNVGSGTGTSINELIGKVSSLLGRPAKVAYTPARSVDVRRNVLDIAKIGSELGWRPALSLEDGIALTYRWLRSGQVNEPADLAAIGKG